MNLSLLRVLLVAGSTGEILPSRLILTEWTIALQEASASQISGSPFKLFGLTALH
jgi:hypothetical protein